MSSIRLKLYTIKRHLNLILSEGWGIAIQYATIEKSGNFEEEWYRKTYDINPADDALLHYILIGDFEGYNPNAVFDTIWYRKQSFPNLSSNTNALIHYLKYGKEYNLGVSEIFHPNEYLKVNKDISEYSGDPLMHYIVHGRKENRPIKDLSQEKKEKIIIKSPSIEDFDNFKPTSFDTNNIKLDIIIPVYRGYDDTLNCILSILNSTNVTVFEIVVIDDCSPDYKLSAALLHLSEKGLITLAINNKNLGFVKSVNKGMKMHPKRDVILLNSDTEVYHNWVDRILLQAKTHNAATVTPLSNNATICSYPEWLKDNNYRLEKDYSELDKLASAANENVAVEIPTGVGFCMYISRESLNALGYFNEKVFDKGYGEENDFCIRAINSGRKNILALDTFVLHTGEVSFADDSNEKKDIGLRSLLKLHPDYNLIIQKHIKENPALRYRQLLDLYRLCNRDKYHRTILIFSHTWGGGIHRYLVDRLSIEKKNDTNFIIAVPDENNEGAWKINALDNLIVPNLTNLSFEVEEQWREWIKRFNIQHIEVHSFAGWPDSTISKFIRWKASVELDYHFYFHDYHFICTKAHLINNEGAPCDINSNNCSCLSTSKLEVWRKNYKDLLQNADKLFAPSNNVIEQVNGIYPELKIQCKPHFEEPIILPTYNKNLNDNIIIGIIGAIGIHKGSHIIRECSKIASEKNLKIKFVIIGYCDIIDNNDFDNITLTGRYEEDEVYDLIRLHKLDAVFIPSIWPETYCYTLTIAMNTGLPVAVFDLGAQAERIENYPKKIILDKALINQPEDILDELSKTISQYETI